MNRADDDVIDMRLREIESVYYDPRADFLAGVALDDDVSAKTSAKLMRDAEAIYRRARARTPRRGSANVRAQVIEALRQIGGAP